MAVAKLPLRTTRWTPARLQVHEPPDRFHLDLSQFRLSPEPSLDLIEVGRVNPRRQITIVVKRGDHTPVSRGMANHQLVLFYPTPVPKTSR
jgi:hypothetical protein